MDNIFFETFSSFVEKNFARRAKFLWDNRPFALQCLLHIIGANFPPDWIWGVIPSSPANCCQLGRSAKRICTKRSSVTGYPVRETRSKFLFDQIITEPTFNVLSLCKFYFIMTLHPNCSKKQTQKCIWYLRKAPSKQGVICCDFQKNTIQIK